MTTRLFEAGKGGGEIARRWQKRCLLAAGHFQRIGGKFAMLLKAQRLATHGQAKMLRAGVRPVQPARAAKFDEISACLRRL